MVKLHIVIPAAGSDETFLGQAKLKPRDCGECTLDDGEVAHFDSAPLNKPAQVRKLCNDLVGDDVSAVSDETLLE